MLGGLAFALSALAQGYPAKPVKIVVGYPPGGSGDFLTRLIADEMGKALGVAVVADNRPGAGGNVAADIVARSAADGYTVLNAPHHSINLALYKSTTYEHKDFIPVTKIATGPTVICVSSAVPAKDLKELIDYAKANPGKLFVASAGYGSAPHLAYAIFESVAGVKFTAVQYKGGGPAAQSLIAGDTNVMFATAPTVMGMVRAGRLRALARIEARGLARDPRHSGRRGRRACRAMNTPSGSVSMCPPARRRRWCAAFMKQRWPASASRK